MTFMKAQEENDKLIEAAGDSAPLLKVLRKSTEMNKNY